MARGGARVAALAAAVAASTMDAAAADTAAMFCLRLRCEVMALAMRVRTGAGTLGTILLYASTITSSSCGSRSSVG